MRQTSDVNVSLQICKWHAVLLRSLTDMSHILARPSFGNAASCNCIVNSFAVIVLIAVFQVGISKGLSMPCHSLGSCKR